VGPELVHVSTLLDRQAASTQAIRVVAAVPAPVIVLSVCLLPVSRRGDGGILECRGGRPVKRRLQNRQPVHRKDADELSKGPPIVRNMLEDVAADDQIERAVLERHVADIEANVGKDRIDVAGYVVEIPERAKPSRETVFGCDVENALSAFR
jgi:hypothetical protein